MAGGSAALWGLAIGLRPLDDNSALTHLATGRLIVKDWAIPRHDPFSFTALGEPWTVYSWLASTGMGLADRAWGGNGIQVARGAFTCLLALLAWRLTRPAGSLAGRIVTVAMVLVVGSGMWSERPLLVALVLLALVVVVAESDRAPIWPVAALMWVWVNVHGSFPFALVYLGTRVLGARLDGNDVRRLRQLLAVAVVGTLAGGINPLGPRLLVFPFQLLARHDLLDRVAEWRSPDFSRMPNLVALAGVLLAVLLSSRRRSLEDGLVSVVFGAAACIALRNLPLATIVLTPVLARGLQGLGSIRGERRSPATAAGSAALAAVAVTMVVVSVQGSSYDLREYPERQLDWMDATGLLERRVATEDFVGNYLTARRGRDASVFFDDRFDMYPRKVVKDSIALVDGREGWQDRLDAYGVEVVLWRRSQPLAGLVALDPDWQVVRKDKKWVVAVRRSDPPSAAALPR